MKHDRESWSCSYSNSPSSQSLPSQPSFDMGCGHGSIESSRNKRKSEKMLARRRFARLVKLVIRHKHKSVATATSHPTQRWLVVYKQKRKWTKKILRCLDGKQRVAGYSPWILEPTS